MHQFSRDSAPNSAFLARGRGEMLGFARLQLGNDDEAEDAVQAALAGALRACLQVRWFQEEAVP